MSPQNPKNATLVPSTLIWNASNDYLKFYTMETNTEKCLLICLVFFGELGQKLVKNKPKIAILSPNLENSIAAFIFPCYIPVDFKVICDGNWINNMHFDLISDVW